MPQQKAASIYQSQNCPFCHVRPENVLSVHNVPNTYHVPLMLNEQGILPMLHGQLNFERFAGKELVPDLTKWAQMAHAQDAFTQDVKIALVGNTLARKMLTHQS